MRTRVGELIGEGSFGQVYKAQNEQGQLFALKKIRLKAFLNEREQVEKESKLMEECDHPNLVKVYKSEYIPKDDMIVILMEYCEAGQLTDWIRSQKLSPSERLNIFKQITLAFIYLNVKGILHRDLKPQNVLLTKNMRVKIADFGCARLLSSDEMSKMDNFSTEKGTPDFVSPQQLMNEDYSVKCDVWAGGCVLYLLMFRKHPFMDRTHSSMIESIKSQTLNKALLLPQDCDPTVARILSITLMYAEKDRASWRELWLSRFFAPKITNVSDFVQYLKRITAIANWISKNFWKEKKPMLVNDFLSHKLTYFLVKFQASTLTMASQILHHLPDYRYLFEKTAYDHFKKNHAEEAEITRLQTNIEMYLSSFRGEFQKTEHKFIIKKDTFRISPFCDLANAIRTAYKILVHAKKNTHTPDQVRVLLCLAKLINFEKWFSYQNNPRVEDLIILSLDNAQAHIEQEIAAYERGEVE